MMVSFCVIRLELEENANTIDINFNSYKSVEDLLEDLSLCEAARPVRPLRDEEERRRFRGNRLMTEVRVETFVDFTTNMDGAGRESKESSPGDSLSTSNSSKDSSKRSTKDSTPASGVNAAESEPLDHISFVSGNPAAEVTNGILHLYKENHTTSLEEGVIRSPMICMLGVPTKLKTPDLLSFTAAVHSQLEMMRIIHDGNPYQYMVLLRFRCQEAADEFYQAFNGQPYNSFEPEDLCHLVYISKVETCKESEYYPLSNHTELPVCSICLERMDESISTVLTILCNHTFHSSCLGQWEDATCPVCRYIQTPELVAEQRCSECNSPDDLWICLICGYVGCGRYIGGHSHAHFLETGHSYTMELGQTSRVWDYVGDNFVHRLLQTDSASGKLVATETRTCPDGKTCDGTCPCGEEKLKSFQLELYYTLTTQLEKQRQHYEAKLAKVEENSQKEIADVMIAARSSSEEAKKLEAKIVSLTKEKAKCESKLNQLSQRLTRALNELVDEKHLNASLRENQQSLHDKMNSYEERLNKRDSEIQDLKEQLRDLMVHFTASEQIVGDADLQEVNGGDLIVQSPTSTTESRSKGAIRKKKSGK